VPSDAPLGRNGVVRRVAPYAPRHTPDIRHPSVRPLTKGRARAGRIVNRRGVDVRDVDSVWKLVCRAVPRPTRRAPHLSMAPCRPLPRGCRTLTYYSRHVDSVGSKTDLRIWGVAGARRRCGHRGPTSRASAARALSALTSPQRCLSDTYLVEIAWIQAGARGGITSDRVGMAGAAGRTGGLGEISRCAARWCPGKEAITAVRRWRPRGMSVRMRQGSGCGRDGAVSVKQGRQSGSRRAGIGQVATDEGIPESRMCSARWRCHCLGYKR